MIDRREQVIQELRDTYKESLFGCDAALKIGDNRAATEFAWRADYAYKAFQQAMEARANKIHRVARVGYFWKLPTDRRGKG